MSWVPFTEVDPAYELFLRGGVQDGHRLIYTGANRTNDYIYELAFSDQAIIQSVKLVLSGSSADSVAGVNATAYGDDTNVVLDIWSNGVEDFTLENLPVVAGGGWAPDILVDSIVNFSGTFELYVWVDAAPSTCFWTNLVKCDQVCADAPPTAEVVFAPLTFRSGSYLPEPFAVDIGLPVLADTQSQTVNLLALPGATYTPATTNVCGEAMTITLSAGVLTAPATQTTGSCVGASPVPVLTIQGGSFPFPADKRTAYAGLLFVSHGSGTSSGFNGGVYLEYFDEYGAPLSDGGASYYSTVAGESNPNTASAHSYQDIGRIAAAIEGAGLIVKARGVDNQPITFQFSTDLTVLVPPVSPDSQYVIVEEAWPVEANAGLGGTEFPTSGGVVDGATIVPLWYFGSDPTANNRIPSYAGDQLTFDWNDFESLFDNSHVYKLSIYAGGTGYTDMVRVGAVKLVPDSGGGGG